MHKRTSGSKLVFYDLHGGGFKVQVMADARYQKFDVLYSVLVGIMVVQYGRSNQCRSTIRPKHLVMLLNQIYGKGDHLL